MRVINSKLGGPYKRGFSDNYKRDRIKLVPIKVNGVQYESIREAARKHGVSPEALGERYRKMLKKKQTREEIGMKVTINLVIEKGE